MFTLLTRLFRPPYLQACVRYLGIKCVWHLKESLYQPGRAPL